jgi:hypothetical protein
VCPAVAALRWRPAAPLALVVGALLACRAALPRCARVVLPVQRIAGARPTG